MTIFLDYNATSPLRPEVKKAIMNFLGPPSNPSSIHKYGRDAKALLERSRQQVASLVGSSIDDVTFTSGGTESNAMVLSNAKKPLISAIEHEAVLKTCKNSTLLKVNQNGVVNLNDLEEKLKKVNPDYLSIMWANNETGVIQPIEKIVEIASPYGVHIHCDAVQALGKIPINFNDSGLDSMSISGHKIGSPAGIGALILSGEADIKPFINGGGQEKGKRSGTENLIGAIGFGTACKTVKSELSKPNQIFIKQKDFENKIKKILKEIIIIGENVPRLPNTSAVYMPFLKSDAQVILMDLNGYAISSGSACSSGKIQSSYVLKAMGLNWAADKTIRISSGWDNKLDDLEKIAEFYIEMYKEAKKNSA